MASTNLVHSPDAADAPWWRHAVIYQIYPRSWADSDGDGIGDLPGITGRLPYLRDLGVDAIWLSPFYVSPQADAGYDVANYRDIDPIFGELSDAEELIRVAHDLGLRVIVDLVPNHTSDEHPWFRAALATGPASSAATYQEPGEDTARARYLFRDGRGERGELPPNNWTSVFGGSAWEPVRDGRTGASGKQQWYLHLFDRKQPDLDWQNPQVHREFCDILRFWLHRGADGFRVDVAHGLVKADGLPDWTGDQHMLGDLDGSAHPGPTVHSPAPMWDQDGVHEIYREWRKVLDEYAVPGEDRDRILCAEAWVDDPERAARYVRPDEMHQAFNFDFLQSPWRAEDLRSIIEESLVANDEVGAPTTWVLSNHDVVRHASRLGLPVGTPRPNGIGIGDPQPDADLGLRRARAATTLMLALPGGAYLYQGEELGLPDNLAIPDELRQDPTWERSGHTERGRDGARVPMPWEGDEPAYGFGPSARTWLPQPEGYGALAVDRQTGMPGSTLELYRTLLRLRRELTLGRGSLAWLEGFGEDVVAYSNEGTGGSAQRIAVVLNLGDEPVALPDGAEVLVASGDLEPGGSLPTDTAAWVRL
ncbi:MAG TPA: alpha-amylase family glycosyl hydrolase [Segeticoccus sp.]|uniref:glycoside hydrolase family 13 protein n=1 Tax=Segeticoccus sp. TaxID=2706531 RepID=UPI002D808E1F|nr:alpha-amylase family glycosyl hydrolase [Segeticoccus sp.]HET8602095.1 alpha-amylase family glycosyl hydrolase [Segeticoccus sp.]